MRRRWPPLLAPSKTLGGRQFWGDVAFFQGYRIQEHVFSGRYRLLDPDDHRRCSGPLAECQQVLERIRTESAMQPMSGRAVVLIHGIVRSSKSFRRLAQHLKDSGATVVGFDYPSTRRPVIDAAAYLRRTLDSLSGIDTVDLVAHSMGGLLVRCYLQSAGNGIDPRLRRMVMMGVPNQGARMANILSKNLLFRWIFGPAGQQLVENPDGFLSALPIPPFEFGVLSGGRGTPHGWNPLIPGDDDGTVSVACTRLAGASDFITVPALHTFLMAHPQAVQATLRFLETGAFRESGQKEPIFAEESSFTKPAEIVAAERQPSQSKSALERGN